MEIDLERAGSDVEGLKSALESQVCVVGGGIAGLVLAQRLVGAGISVILLEAGGRERSGSSSSDPFAAELQGQPHAGTRVGRVRAIGGSSLTWGGQLLPLPEDAGWPISASELRPFEVEAEQMLGVDGLPYDATEFFKRCGSEGAGDRGRSPG